MTSFDPSSYQKKLISWADRIDGAPGKKFAGILVVLWFTGVSIGVILASAFTLYWVLFLILGTVCLIVCPCLGLGIIGAATSYWLLLRYLALNVFLYTGFVVSCVAALAPLTLIKDRSRANIAWVSCILAIHGGIILSMHQYDLLKVPMTGSWLWDSSDKNKKISLQYDVNRINSDIEIIRDYIGIKEAIDAGADDEAHYADQTFGSKSTTAVSKQSPSNNSYFTWFDATPKKLIAEGYDCSDIESVDDKDHSIDRSTLCSHFGKQGQMVFGVVPTGQALLFKEISTTTVPTLSAVYFDNKFFSLLKTNLGKEAAPSIKVEERPIFGEQDPSRVWFYMRSDGTRFVLLKSFGTLTLFAFPKM